MALIERTFRERIILVGVTIPPGTTEDETEAHLDELAQLVDTAGADVVGRMCSAARRPTRRPTSARARPRSSARCRSRSTPTPSCSTTSCRRRSSATSRRSSGARRSTAPTVILDIFAQNARTQEGKAQVELAQLRHRLPRLRGRAQGCLSQQARWRRRPHRTRGPGETQLEVDRRRLLRRMYEARGRPQGAAQAPRRTQRKAAARVAAPHRVDRRLHQRRQVDAAQPAHRRRRARRGPAVRHARPAHPPARPARRRGRAADRHRRLRPQAARTSSSRRSSRRSRSWPSPTCSCTSSTPRRPTRGADRRGARGARGDRRRRVPELLVFNKADVAPPEAKRLVDAHPGFGRDLGRDRRGHRRASSTRSATGCGRCRRRRRAARPLRARRRARRACTARARCSSRAHEDERHAALRARLDDGRRQPLPRSSVGRGERSTRRHGLRPAAVPLRPPRPAEGRRPTRTTAAWSTSRSARPTDPPPPARARRAGRRRTPSAATRRRSARPRFREAACGWMARRLGVDVARVGGRRVHRHQGARRRPARTGCAAHARRATPCCTRRSAYPTYEMGAILAGCRAVPVPVDDRVAARPRRPSPTPTPARALVPVGRTRRATPPAARRPRRRGGVGSRRTACRCFATSATSSSPGTGRRARSSSTGTDGVVAVHSLSKRSNLAGVRAGFYAGDADLVELPRRGAQARRVHGARTGAGRRRRPRSATTTTSTRSAPATASGSSCFAGVLRARIGVDVAAARRRLLPVGAGARRRRVGLRRAAGRRGRRAGHPGRLLRSAGRRARAGRDGPADGAARARRAALGGLSCRRAVLSSSRPRRSAAPSSRRAGPRV